MVLRSALGFDAERRPREQVPLYAESGIEWIWLVDPDERRVEVLHVEGGRAVLIERLEGAVQRTIAPFASLVETSRWWVEPPAAT